MSGAWNLHQLLTSPPAALEESEFVAFSSVSSLLGSAGQSNYASANACLDALCQHRRALGLSGTSVQWGPWRESGMATQVGVLAQIARRGVFGIDTTAAMRCLATVVASTCAGGPVCVGVLAQLPVAVVKSGEVVNDASSESNVRHAALPQPSEKSASTLYSLEDVCEQVMSIASQFIVSGEQSLCKDTPLMEAGVDSLGSTELRRLLADEFFGGAETALPATLMFHNPTVSRISHHIFDLLTAEHSRTVTSPSCDDSLLEAGLPAPDAPHADMAPSAQSSSTLNNVLQGCGKLLNSGAPANSGIRLFFIQPTPFENGYSKVFASVQEFEVISLNQMSCQQDLQNVPSEHLVLLHASLMCDKILQCQPEGPFFIAGHSNSSQLGLYVAMTLCSRGHCVKRVFFGDLGFPDRCVSPCCPLRRLSSGDRPDFMAALLLAPLSDTEMKLVNSKMDMLAQKVVDRAILNNRMPSFFTRTQWEERCQQVRSHITYLNRVKNASLSNIFETGQLKRLAPGVVKVLVASDDSWAYDCCRQALENLCDISYFVVQDSGHYTVWNEHALEFVCKEVCHANLSDK